MFWAHSSRGICHTTSVTPHLSLDTFVTPHLFWSQLICHAPQKNDKKYNICHTPFATRHICHTTNLSRPICHAPCVTRLLFCSWGAQRLERREAETGGTGVNRDGGGGGSNGDGGGGNGDDESSGVSGRDATAVVEAKEEKKHLETPSGGAEETPSDAFASPMIAVLEMEANGQRALPRIHPENTVRPSPPTPNAHYRPRNEKQSVAL